MQRVDPVRRIRVWLVVFMTGLVLSGVTAFPLESELRWAVGLLHSQWLHSLAQSTGVMAWLERVYAGTERNQC